MAIYCVFLLFCNVPILGSVLFCVTNKHHPMMKLQAVYITLKRIQGLDATRHIVAVSSIAKLQS